MTEHRTLNTVIHAAFRRDLKRLDDALGSFDGSRPRADALGRAWDNYATQLHQHHQDEETIFWPAFVSLGVDRELMASLEGEHDAMTRALEEAESAMAAFHADPTEVQAATARGRIQTLHDVLDAHLEHEERDLEPWAAQQMETSEVKAAAKAVRKAHQGGAGTFMAWLQDGADADAIAFMRKEIPPPVLFMITRLGGRQYRRDVASVWS
ncbi:hemerythrin domain-containing protein [Aeromicrobium terrae]|uniref:Hemerythrin domain-containing protein n=1 Tax=Aeromicrobium terrae TaxID=2498846 RepID=A0A5C8NN67_9ACTN|nr:hemerythrin domain-containing protein [Aeromicrobium terrae]TXL62231.1 hemerythrin domain-containing protein [Aeromicrobium terrae]